MTRRSRPIRYRPPVTAPTVFSEPFTTTFALTWTAMAGGTLSVTGGTQGTIDGSFVSRDFRAEHDVGSSDMYAQVDWVSGSTDLSVGVWTRLSASAMTGYFFEVNDTLNRYLFKRYVNGVSTDISDGFVTVPAGISVPVTARLESEGSTHRLYLGSTLINTYIDSTITTGQRGGLGAYNSNGAARLDNFSTSRLGATQTPITFTATPQAGQVTLQWSTTRSDITSWTVARDGTDIDGNGPWSTTLPPTTTSIIMDKLTSGVSYGFTLTPQTASGALTPLTASATPTGGVVIPPPVSTGNWLSGVSLAGATDGSFGNWRGRASACIGTWCDSADAQVNLWTIQPGEPGNSWQGGMDIAIGGIFTDRGESWAAAASGAYDSRFTSVFQKLNQLRGGKGPLFVRFAHELNGNWYPWSINSGNVSSFITAWRRVYSIKQAQFPAAKLVFCPNYESTNGVAWTSMWPGDQYVDVLGVDYYNQYAVLVNNSGEWTSKLNATGTVGGVSEPHGLGAYRQYAQDHGKPLGLGEWGANSEATSDSGNAAFLTGLLNYVSSNAGPGAGQFVYDVYFNATDSFGYNGRFGLWPTTHMPNAANAYNAFF